MAGTDRLFARAVAFQRHQETFMKTTLLRSPTAPSEFVGRPHDFDFLVGRWRVADRRLRRRHVGADDWDCFEHISQAWSLLDGLVSVDDNDFESRGFRGCSFRSLDVAAQQWAIYWVNSRDGRLQPPVFGGWNGDRGEFHGDDEDEGRPVHVRFVWERLGPGRARWAQDFAPIGDGSWKNPAWERNWVMALTRIRD
jgi:hypothetical protein